MGASLLRSRAASTNLTEPASGCKCMDAFGSATSRVVDEYNAHPHLHPLAVCRRDELGGFVHEYRQLCEHVLMRTPHASRSGGLRERAATCWRRCHAPTVACEGSGLGRRGALGVLPRPDRFRQAGHCGSSRIPLAQEPDRDAR